ncbi:Yip1 domain protein [Piedraia hortae CBS 480.64]|uniref:Protein YIP n=1 Tax=Piedraia hortae CBS 480.64 TaxID=1314780 RepID=A0A6A7CBX9_9PEZI|nr:Yip1 domain protein [Piedraia hortae CBS 480.64]
MPSSTNPDPDLSNDLIDPDDATLDELDDPIPSSDRAPLTGNISTPSGAPVTRQNLTNAIPGEDRRLNTIDESVWETLSRDMLAVAEKMKQVLWPKYLLGGVLNPREGDVEGGNPLRRVGGLIGRWPDADAVLDGRGVGEWDLWGPLLFSLLLSLLLSLNARPDQKSLVFSGVFALLWLAEGVITLQIKLLGGNISFFQSISIIGYTLFPLVLASLLSAVHVPMVARIPVYTLLGLWSLAAGVSILGGSGVVKNRVALAVYPLAVFYVGVDCLCFLS